MSRATRSPAAEVVEDYTKLARELIKKWSDYADHVAENLSAGTYKADTATADLAGGVSLTIETGFKLAWEAFDAFTILTGGLYRPHVVESEVFTVQMASAKLMLNRDLENSFGDRLRNDAVSIIPVPSDPAKTKFKLRVNATDCHAGTYSGDVTASNPGSSSTTVTAWITVP